MSNEDMEGDELGTYVVLERTVMTEQGTAYSPRGPGSRSLGSTRGSDDPPGSAGKQHAGEARQVLAGV
jgi:hypothetical protein